MPGGVAVTSFDAYWSRTAASWHLRGSPLRPVAADIDLYQQALRRWRRDRAAPCTKLLLLGVTQELRAMDWPAETELLACDRSPAMIGTIWPRAGFNGRFAAPVCADWRALPLPDASRHAAIGDNCAMLLAPRALRQVIDGLARVLDQGAALILRLHMRPDSPESAASIAAEALAGRIGSFDAFKWRLAMAVQGASDAGVRLADVWAAFAALFPDRLALSRLTAWSVASIDTIDSYRDSDVRYYYHRLDEFAQALQPACEIVSADYPSYELGERCPVVAALRR